MRRAREEGLIETAIALLNEKGYEALTMDDLAAAARVSKATLYKHFPSKEELIVRVVLSVMGSVEAFVAGLDRSMPPLERYEAIVRRLLQTRLRLGWAGGLTAASIIPSVLQHPEYRRRFLGLIDQLVGLIDEAKARGEVDPALSSRIIAQAPVSIVRDIEYPMLQAANEADADEIITTLMALLMRGMRRTGSKGKK